MATQELFGPILSIMEPFDSLEQVIEQLNASPYGLAAGFFSENLSETQYVTKNLSTGMLWINTYNDCPPEVPFAGRRRSGLGSELGLQALDEFSVWKSVVYG